MPPNLDSPPKGYLDDKGMIRDRFDRRVPTRFSAANLLPSVPGLLAQFRQVPDGYVTGSGGVAEVACPCGESPRMQPGEMTECGCGRFFVNAVEHVLVASAPKGQGAEVVD